MELEVPETHTMLFVVIHTDAKSLREGKAKMRKLKIAILFLKLIH